MPSGQKLTFFAPVGQRAQLVAEARLHARPLAVERAIQRAHQPVRWRFDAAEDGERAQPRVTRLGTQLRRTQSLATSRRRKGTEGLSVL